jgi:hypothetical protein
VDAAAVLDSVWSGAKVVAAFAAIGLMMAQSAAGRATADELAAAEVAAAAGDVVLLVLVPDELPQAVSEAASASAARPGIILCRKTINSVVEG